MSYKKITINIYWAILLIILGVMAHRSRPQREIYCAIKEVVVTDTVYVDRATGTYYNPVKKQCNDNPLVTASGYKIDTTKLQSGELRIIAVSRDLLRIYSYGDSIYITSDDTLKNGWWRIEDTMNKRFSNYVDFLQPTNTKMIGKSKIWIHDL